MSPPRGSGWGQGALTPPGVRGGVSTGSLANGENHQVGGALWSPLTTQLGGGPALGSLTDAPGTLETRRVRVLGRTDRVPHEV